MFCRVYVRLVLVWMFGSDGMKEEVTAVPHFLSGGTGMH